LRSTGITNDGAIVTPNFIMVCQSWYPHEKKILAARESIAQGALYQDISTFDLDGFKSSAAAPAIKAGEKRETKNPLPIT
jgi:hypothetical protein